MRDHQKGKGNNGRGHRSKNRVITLGVPNMAPTGHHIVPSSRLKEAFYKIYRGERNFCDVPVSLHADFHRLVRNLTPPEILALFVEKVWKGQVFWLHIYLANPQKYIDEVCLNGFYDNARDKSDRLVSVGLDKSPTIHHIVSSSRVNEIEYSQYVGKKYETELPKTFHDYFHWVFINFTPPEVLAILVEKFWAGQKFWLDIYLTNPATFNEEIEGLI